VIWGWSRRSGDPHPGGVGVRLQLIVFILLFFVLVAASRRFAERFTKAQPPGIDADRFVGEICDVLDEINNPKNTGRVRMNREEWRAESDTGEVLAPGTRVVVMRLSGTHLVVKKIPE